MLRGHGRVRGASTLPSMLSFAVSRLSAALTPRLPLPWSGVVCVQQLLSSIPLPQKLRAVTPTLFSWSKRLLLCCAQRVPSPPGSCHLLSFLLSALTTLALQHHRDTVTVAT